MRRRHLCRSPGTRPRKGNAAALGTLLIVAVLSVWGAALIQRRINRPLSHLVEAAKTLAAGSPLTLGGAKRRSTPISDGNAVAALPQMAKTERADLRWWHRDRGEFVERRHPIRPCSYQAGNLLSCRYWP